METTKLERVKRIKKLAIWTWTWVATMAIASFGPQYIWEKESVLTLVLIGLNFIIGIGMVLSNRDLFNHFDELERKIHLESMGITLGLAVVVGLSFSLLDQKDLIPFDAEIAFLVIFIGLCYLTSIFINIRRFK